MKGGQYALCIALIVDGDVKVGVLGCPNLPITMANGSSSTGVLAFGVAGGDAYHIPLNHYGAQKPMLSKMSRVLEISEAKFFSSRYDKHKQIITHLGIETIPSKVDSQVKYAMMAQGDVSLYIRLPRKGKEEIWV